MAWYNSSWNYRVKITVDADKISSNLTNFPVFVNLNNLPAGFHTNVNQTDARDIRVTTSDGVTECPREIVFYTAATDTGEIHFKAPSLSSSTDTDFYIYYGNSGASDYAADATYGAENVWDSNYQLVMHMHQDPSGAAPQMRDSTSNDRHGTSVGTMTSGDLVTGKIGNALDFDGSDDYIDVNGYGGVGGSTNRTISAIIKRASGASSEVIVGYGSTASGAKYHFRIESTLEAIRTEVQNGYVYGTTDVCDAAWHHVASVLDGTDVSDIIHYVDGAAESVGAIVDITLDTSTANDVWIGDCEAHTLREFEGQIDEVRISDIARSSHWMLAEYNNTTPSTFYAVGSQETGSAVKDIIQSGLIAFPR